jgi:hypothetical protein
MPHDLRDSADRTELVSVIRHVRNRWRLKVALRGALIVTGAAAAILLLGAWGLEVLKFSPPAIIAFRIAALAILALLAAYVLVRPLMRRVSPEQVALYLEEHEPSLDAEILSAVEVARLEGPGASRTSSAIVRRLVESALEKCRTIDFGHGIEQPRIKAYSAAVAGIALAAVVTVLLGPAYLRHGVSALLNFGGSVEAASPYRIEVAPGNATLPRGVDQTITARLVGFTSDNVELLMRTAPETPFEILPFVAADDGGFEAMLFDLSNQVEYFVRADGVRSGTFILRLVDLPYVQRLDLEYHFPAYTGLPPQTVENGGDIAAVRGTEVRLRAFPTIPTPRGQIVLDGSDPLPLARADDGTLTGALRVERQGFYQIEFEGLDGERVTASPQFTIDVLADQPPSVSFDRPGRDTTATPLEEVFVSVRADDDFGVRSMELVYSVNGGPEQKVPLLGGRPLKEVTAGHTFYLEELDLEPGDFVSYYARATDNDAVGGAKTVTSDLYFLQIRPFVKEFMPAQSMAGGGGGGGANTQVDALSQQQRQIIAATFNVVRDRRTYSADRFKENMTLLAVAQGRLREQVEGLVRRMNSPLVEPDPAFKKIAELMPRAAEEMQAAESLLRTQKPSEALAPEQRALQYLQKAEEEYQLQVAQGGGGGGGGAGSIAEDLADLFRNEMNRLANQYETAQRADQQQADAQLDALMERLRELARRQEQEAERQRRMAAGDRSAQVGSAARQRALAEEAEQAARRLERLAREQQRQDLADAARRLQEAADAMRRAAASGNNGSAQASSALNRLREAQERLERGQAAQTERQVQDALRQAEALAQEQREVAEEARSLQSSAGRATRARDLMDRKDSMESRVGDLERQLERAAGDLASSEPNASRRLRDAAGSIGTNQLKDKIRYSKGLLQERTAEASRKAEAEIGANLDELRRKVADAAAAVGSGPQNARGDALERARDLARGMESLEARLRERTQEEGARGQQGQEGQQGQGGQQGQAGQQGQGGQQGQEGRGGQAGDAGNADGRGGAWGGGPDGARGYGWGDGMWGQRPLSPEERRQFGREIREWTSEAQELRRQLLAEGVSVAELDEILRRWRALDAERLYVDPRELEKLQTYVVEGLKKFEFNLRRKLERDDERLLLSGSDDVPAGFRPLVEEYYRALSRERGR